MTYSLEEETMSDHSNDYDRERGDVLSGRSDHSDDYDRYFLEVEEDRKKSDWCNILTERGWGWGWDEVRSQGYLQ